MSKIRITQTGWSNYTGYFGVTEFKDGVSLDDVPENEIKRLGSLVLVERLETGEQAGASTVWNKMRSVSADDCNKKSEDDLGGTEVINDEYHVYTQEELESIADTQGIVALRTIGERYGVRAKSIIELIKGVLKKQGLSYVDSGYYVKS